MFLSKYCKYMYTTVSVTIPTLFYIKQKNIFKKMENLLKIIFSSALIRQASVKINVKMYENMINSYYVILCDIICNLNFTILASYEDSCLLCTVNKTNY